MARYTGPKCKLCRREGSKLFLKGYRCNTSKCPIDRKGALPPGQHGQKKSRRRVSSYGIQLREKQKAKRIYWVTEKQFKNYYQKASKQKGNAGDRLMQLLESRLDNILFKGGLVSSRSIARQMINHGLCLVDGKKVDIPSFQIKKGQIISLNTKGLKSNHIKKSLEMKNSLPDWLKKKGAVIKMERLPEDKELDLDIDKTLIVEFYSR